MTRRPVLLSEGPPLTAADVADAARIEMMGVEQLPRLRATAEKWRNGLGISVVLSGIAAFLGSQDMWRQLDPGWSVATFISSLVAIVAALTSVGSSLRAAAGWPGVVQLTSPSRLRAWEAREFSVSLSWLRLSVGSAFLALVATAAAGLMYFAAPAGEGGHLAVELTDSSTLCVSALDRSGDLLVLHLGDGGVQVVPSDDLLAIIPRRVCP